MSELPGTRLGEGDVPRGIATGKGRYFVNVHGSTDDDARIQARSVIGLVGNLPMSVLTAKTESFIPLVRGTRALRLSFDLGAMI